MALDDSTAAANRYLNYYAEQPMRCKSCGRVCAFIDDDLCGSPVCRMIKIELGLDQVSLENRELDLRLTKIEKGDKN